MSVTRDRIERLRGLYEAGSSRPWSSVAGVVTCEHYDVANVTGGTNGEPDAALIAEAVNLGEAMLAIAEAALDWVDDDGSCHFCGLEYTDATQELGPHDDGCPLGALEEALGRG